MKILYFLLLSTSIFCLNSKLMNSTEFQKKKTEFQNQILKRLNLTMPKNYQNYIENFNFIEGKILIDFLPLESIAYKVIEFGITSDEMEQILIALEMLPYTNDPTEYFSKNVDWKGNNYSYYFYNLTTSIIKVPEGSLNGLFIIRGKTHVKTKTFYEDYQAKECSKFLFFKKCKLVTRHRERPFTKEESYIVGNATIAYTLSEIKKKLVLK